MPPEQDPSDWRRRLRSGEIRRLFEHVPGTLFFAKNAGGEIMMGNRQFVERCGFENEQALVGRSDQEIFPPHMAEKYREDDLQVIRSGAPLLQIVELFPNRHGDPEWFITDKLPLFDLDGRVCGVCGIVRSYEGTRRVLQPYLDLAPVADYIKAHCGEPISIPELAKMAGLSIRQFERNFLSTFRTTPKHYIMRLRVLLACDQLLETRRSITDIALGVGFCDHSAFARHFRKQMALSPRDYREKYLNKPTARGPSKGGASASVKAAI